MKTTSNIDRASVNADLIATYGPLCTRENFAEYAAKTGVDPRWIYYTAEARARYRVGRGQYRVPGASDTSVATAQPAARVARTPKTVAVAPVLKTAVVVAPAPLAPAAEQAESLAMSVTPDMSKNDILAKIRALATDQSELCKVPAKSSAFVPFGDFEVIRTIIRSGQFHPVFITGLSGNGKTFGVQQACAMEKREYLRVNVTAESDEDDFLGGFRLKNGETVFELGPIVVAMIRGTVTLIDEIDLAGPKIMCLQSIMEGNGVTLKKLGVTIMPAPGFTVFATANTKGRGSDDGKFVGTNLLNEAFLERFPITIEQPYPSIAVEKKILTKTYEMDGGTMTPETVAFFETLAKWAEAIRVTYYEEGIEDLVTTRRLVHIVRTFEIFGNPQRSVALCLNRFEKSVQTKFLDFFAKMSPEAAVPSTTTNVTNDAQF
tara:strand:- start:3206 stop:4504 length:1299 start_codon:yes stop_codon:yes gene_type:complete